MDLKQFREAIVRPTLQAIMLWSAEAEELLIATAAHESAGLRYIKQVRGPALSFYQIEPATAREVWDRWLPRQSARLKDLVKIETEFRPGDLLERRLLGDLHFATIVARLNYRRFPEALPSADDVPAMARLWKKRWNTAEGAGTEEQFIANYERFVKRTTG